MEETKRCPYCGEEILTTAKKCRYCGEWLNEVEEKPKPKMVKCPICGESIEEGIEICPFCKEKVDIDINETTDENQNTENPFCERPDEIKAGQEANDAVMTTDNDDDNQSFFSYYFAEIVSKDYANFKGKMPRQRYWIYIIMVNIIGGLIGGLTLFTGNQIVILMVILIYNLGFFLPLLSATIRRLHDSGKSGWMFCINFIPFIGIIWLLILLCSKGETKCKVQISQNTIIVIIIALIAVFIIDIIGCKSYFKRLVNSDELTISAADNDNETFNAADSAALNPISDDISTVNDDISTVNDNISTVNDEAENESGIINEQEQTGTEDDNTDVNNDSQKEQTQEIKKEDKKENIDYNKVFDNVEQNPTFPGGQAELMAWISNHLKYPAIAAENGIEGKVIIQFVVGRNGAIRDANVVRALNPSCDREALRVVNSMPRWSPGKQDGKVVSVKFTMPITFKLQ